MRPSTVWSCSDILLGHSIAVAANDPSHGQPRPQAVGILGSRATGRAVLTPRPVWYYIGNGTTPLPGSLDCNMSEISQGILFLGVASSARSQMALARAVLGDAVRVQSAGSRPSQLNPSAKDEERNV